MAAFNHLATGRNIEAMNRAWSLEDPPPKRLSSSFSFLSFPLDLSLPFSYFLITVNGSRMVLKGLVVSAASIEPDNVFFASTLPLLLLFENYIANQNGALRWCECFNIYRCIDADRPTRSICTNWPVEFVRKGMGHSPFAAASSHTIQRYLIKCESLSTSLQQRYSHQSNSNCPIYSSFQSTST